MSNEGRHVDKEFFCKWCLVQFDSTENTDPKACFNMSAHTAIPNDPAAAKTYYEKFRVEIRKKEELQSKEDVVKTGQPVVKDKNPYARYRYVKLFVYSNRKNADCVRLSCLHIYADGLSVPFASVKNQYGDYLPHQGPEALLLDGNTFAIYVPFCCPYRLRPRLHLAAAEWVDHSFYYGPVEIVIDLKHSGTPAHTQPPSSATLLPYDPLSTDLGLPVDVVPFRVRVGSSRVGLPGEHGRSSLVPPTRTHACEGITGCTGNMDGAV
jgi:hypothetical protein